MKNKNKIKIRILLFILGAVSLVNVIFMFSVANPTFAFNLQAFLSICLMVYAIFFNKIHRKIHITLTVLVAIPLSFALFLGIYGNVSNVDFTEDAVIVLGAGIQGERVTRPLSHRLDAAIVYWNENPDAVIVVTGGLGNRATITEAEAMSRYLIARGVPPSQILLEELSTSTYENLMFAKEILEETFDGDFRVVVISNDFHIFRAIRIARQLGLDANRLGAYTDWYTWPVNYLREMVAVLNFWIFVSESN